MRRAQVIDAAADVLREVGTSEFTPAAVARRAGLARSSIYQYYPSTEALLGAGVTALLQRSRDRVLDAVSGAGSPAERVAAYVRASWADAAEGHGSLAELAHLRMPDQLRAGVRELHTQLLGPLESALIDAQVPDPATAAVLVQGLVGAGVAAVRRGASQGRFVDATVEFVLLGLGLVDQDNRLSPR